MQARTGRIQPGRQLLVVLLRRQQLLAQGDVFPPQRVAELGHLADFGFESIEFGVHGGTIGGDVRTVNPDRIMRAFRCRGGLPPPRINGKQVRGRKPPCLCCPRNGKR